MEKNVPLEVIKANKIIPKCIAVKDAVGEVEIPKECPVCHAPTEIRISKNSGTKTLHCTNPDCTAKNVKKFTRFVSKWGMDIDGLSIQTMLKFINEGYIHEFADIYHLKDHFDVISQMEGFGEKSVNNMDKSIEKSRNVHPVNFIFRTVHSADRNGCREKRSSVPSDLKAFLQADGESGGRIRRY